MIFLESYYCCSFGLGFSLNVCVTCFDNLSVFKWMPLHHEASLWPSMVLSDISRALRSPQTIFSNPLSLALCVSMCLGKTAFCTNWSQWHKLQGRVNKLRLHGNTCWQVCPVRSLQRYIEIAVYTNLKPITKRKRRVEIREGLLLSQPCPCERPMIHVCDK